MGLYNYSNEYMWNFGFQPEIGLLLEINDAVSFSINAGYHQVLGNESIDTQSYFSLGAGIMLHNLGTGMY